MTISSLFAEEETWILFHLYCQCYVNSENETLHNDTRKDQQSSYW